MKACKGPGKAQPKNLIIDTPLGKKRFGDLLPNSWVFAEDGTETYITKIFDRGMLQTYEVFFDDGTSTVVCGEHLWKVRGRTERRHDTWTIINTNEIIQRGVREKNGQWEGRQFEIPRQGKVVYDQKNLSIDSYLFGIWLGDGAKGTPTITTADLEIIEEIISRGYKVSIQPNGSCGNAAPVRILNNVDNFKQIEVFDLGSHERFIPNQYKYSSIDQRIDLLRGIMDSDGTIGTDNHIDFASSSKQLVDDVTWLVRSLGGIAIKKKTRIGKYKDETSGKIIECKLSYRVTITTDFCPFILPRKANRWHHPQDRYLTRYIDRIEKIDIQDCMCIEIAHHSHCYLTNDFIVTHNTCLLSWIAWNFLLTRPFPRIAATSISADNLSDTLWPEMAKWQHKSELLTNMFTWTKTRITQNEHPEIWWMSARTWSKTADKTQQSNTLAGLHEDYIMFLLDESGGIPDAVMTTAEAALSSCVEGHVIQAGNPTMLEGPLYRACHEERYLWYVIEITGDPDNPKRSPRIKIEWANEEIKRHGRENPWVLINVFGEFPPSSLNALIGPDEVREAMNRYYRPYEIGTASKILGVDVARYGDDSSVIALREGIQLYPFKQMRNLNSTEGASWVTREWDAFSADACFIDDTGGFGSGWVDQLKNLGRTPIGVSYSRKAHQSDKYYNKRSEMYFEAVEWIKNGGALPECDELLEALTKTTYSTPKGLLLLEPKEMVKAKIHYSPDHADAFVQTFAEPVTIQRRKGFITRHTSEYDPFSQIKDGYGNSLEMES